MSSSIKSLINSGTKLWLDSIDPDLILSNKTEGATGATSNPIIISDLIKTGRFDGKLVEFAEKLDSDEEIAWAMTDCLVNEAQAQFVDVWEATHGNDGYVSFELDPLLEDPELDLPHDHRVKSYIDSGIEWSEGHSNRMIKVPATPAGLDALEELAAAGVSLNVTLIFTEPQYRAARDAVWRGAQRRGALEQFKSVYSIFVSRIDVYTEKHCPDLSPMSQGQVGIVNAQRIWAGNQEFWSDKGCPLEQEIIFASTGTKKPEDPAWKYVQALAGSDIQTNPPATNDAVAKSGLEFTKRVDQLPSEKVLAEIYGGVNFDHMHETLMQEGIDKFAAPQKSLLELIAEKRALAKT